jgi:hypothetical protein
MGGIPIAGWSGIEHPTKMDDLGVPPWIGNLQMMVVLRKIMPPTVYFRLVSGIWISIVPHPRIVPVRTVAICGSAGNSVELKCGVSWECTPVADHLETDK